MTLKSEYYAMYKRYLKHEITEEAWRDYCVKTLAKVMLQNADVLKRLKEI